MKTSDIKKQAREVISNIFYKAIESDDKEVWKKSLAFIDTKIQTLESGDRGEEMFVWRNVKQQIIFLFGKKFIVK